MFHFLINRKSIMNKLLGIVLMNLGEAFATSGMGKGVDLLFQA